jgi:hypothetical protein
VELLVASAIGGIVLTAVAGFTVYSMRSFVGLSNYADLEEKSRRTVDEMTQQIREATAVVQLQSTGNKRWLILTNSTPGASNKFMKYTWSSQDRVLYYERTGSPAKTNLTECDDWVVTILKRNPIPGTTNQFFPATNSAGQPDPKIAKLVDMKWRCSRKVLGKTYQTETVQTTKIVLRNR